MSVCSEKHISCHQAISSPCKHQRALTQTSLAQPATLGRHAMYSSLLLGYKPVQQVAVLSTAVRCTTTSICVSKNTYPNTEKIQQNYGAQDRVSHTHTHTYTGQGWAPGPPFSTALSPHSLANPRPHLGGCRVGKQHADPRLRKPPRAGSKYNTLVRLSLLLQHRNLLRMIHCNPESSVVCAVCHRSTTGPYEARDRAVTWRRVNR